MPYNPLFFLLLDEEDQGSSIDQTLAPPPQPGVVRWGAPAALSVQPVTASVDVKLAAGAVYWVSHHAGLGGGAWQIKDTDPDVPEFTTVVSGNTAGGAGTQMLVFDPAIECPNGIYANVEGTNVTLHIGYA